MTRRRPVPPLPPAGGGAPGVDRPFRPEDIDGRVAVAVRGPGRVEVLTAPDRAVLTAGEILTLLHAGAAAVVTRPEGAYLTVGYAWPISTSGRVVYLLDQHPAQAAARYGHTTPIEGTRVA